MLKQNRFSRNISQFVIIGLFGAAAFLSMSGCRSRCDVSVISNRGRVVFNGSYNLVEYYENITVNQMLQCTVSRVGCAKVKELPLYINACKTRAINQAKRYNSSYKIRGLFMIDPKSIGNWVKGEEAVINGTCQGNSCR